MEIILLEKIANLGNMGEKVNVKPGYGSNYLIPQGKAAAATAGGAVGPRRRAEQDHASSPRPEPAASFQEKGATLCGEVPDPVEELDVGLLGTPGGDVGAGWWRRPADGAGGGGAVH